MKTTTIQEALTPVVGLPLRCIGRAANMLWLHFGEMRIVPAHGGGTKTVGDWAIHVQCPWRISQLGRIVIAYHDFYYSPDGDALDDWDTLGKSRFDSVAARLCTEFRQLRRWLHQPTLTMSEVFQSVSVAIIGSTFFPLTATIRASTGESFSPEPPASILFFESMRKTWSNKSLQATRDGRSSSAIAEDVISPACLSSGR